jgi:hypothetical protein
MKRILLVAALALAACSQRGRPEGPVFNIAQPSEVVAAELAFAQLAQERGQWTAFRQTAAADAEMFVPERANAQQWLRGRSDPPVAVRWQPHEVWISHDGSLAVTYGAWQRPAGTGYFITVWRRQRDGKFRWVLDQGADLDEPLPAPEMLRAHVADERPGSAAQIEPCRSASGEPVISHISKDSTLQACTVLFADGHRQFGLFLIQGPDYATVFNRRVPAPAQ